MSVDAVRKILGALQEDPENESAWTQLEERAVGGELANLGSDSLAVFEQARRRYLERGEAEAAARMLDIEALASDRDPARKVGLVRERARLLEEELLDDKSALSALEGVKAQDPEAAEAAERIARKKEKWKELVEAYKKHALETPDPSQIASHLASAAAVILQYKSKGRDKDVDTLFSEALSVDPSNVRAIQLYERILRRRGKNWDDLASHLERGAVAVIDIGTKISLWLRAARVHAGRRKDFASAERIYRQILKFDPANHDANRFLVILLSEQNRTDDLVKLYEDQLRLAGHEQDIGLLVQVAMTHWRMRNDAASAVPYFRRVAELQPEHPLPQNFFGEHPQWAPTDLRKTEPDDVEFETGESEEEIIDETEAPAPVAAEPAATVPTPSAPSTPPPAAAPSVPPPAPTPSMAPPAATPSMAPPAAGARPAVGRVAIAIDLARQAEESGQTDRAIEAWKGVARLDAGNGQARDALHRLYAQAGRWNNLVELLRQELEALGGTKPGGDPANRERKLEILRDMVRIYADKMALEPMVVQTYNAILALAPDDLDALVNLGKSYEKLGRHTDLIKVLEQQAEHTREPATKIELLRRIAKIWVERFNNVNNATKPLEQILQVDPSNSEALAELKDLYGKRRAWRPLFDVLRKESETLSGQAKRDALVEMAKLGAEKLNSPSDAIAVWREALAIDPSTPGALDALEKLTERERDYAGLADVLEKRAAETSDVEARVNVLMKLGTVYGERLNDNTKSIDAWRRVLAARPGHPKALRVLRESYSTAGDWDALETLYSEANDYEGLVEVLGGAADRSEDPATRIALSFRAASVYENQLNSPARAFRSYERVLTADPKNLRAAQALVPIYLSDEKWPRLAQLYEVLLAAVPEGDVDESLSYIEKLRELNASRLADRQAAFRWALRAYRLRPEDRKLEATLERAASDANAWREFVDTLDARAKSAESPAEQARLRDKTAAIEADRLGAVDAAIDRYQGALKRDASNPEIIETLDRLLRRAERWTDLRALFDHRLAIADDSARRSMLFEVAEIEERNLRDTDAAAKRYRDVLALDAHDPEALAALSRLAEAGGRWEELGTLIAQRRDEATGSVRAELAFKLGELQSERLGNVDAAIVAWREVLSLVPHHPGTLASLEALLRHEKYRVTAAGLLEPEFEAIGEARKLAWVLQILLDATTDSTQRKALTLRLSRVYSDSLADPRSAFELLRGVLLDHPDDRELAEEFETVAAQGSWNEELADTFAKIANRPDLDAAVKIDLARRAANAYDDRLRRPEAAEPFHKMVVDAGDLDQHAFEQLKVFYQERERWDDLRGVYATWVERSTDVGSKIELLSEEALVVEEILDRPADAVTVYEKIHALDPSNRNALRALDRLLTRQGRWSDLEALFTQWLDIAPAEGKDLRFRRAEVAERELSRFDAAVTDYEAVLNEEPTHAGARQGLERIVSSRPELKLRAGAILEHLYENDGDASARDLVRMLLVRLEGTADADERSNIWRRVAELREVVLNDVEGAFAATVEAMQATPENESTRAELLRLASASGQNQAAAESLERASNAAKSPAALVPLLRDLAGVYDDRLAELPRAEATYRRLLEAAGDDAEVSLHAATALERIYPALNQPRGLVDALRLRAKYETDPDVQRELHARAGQIQELELNDSQAAIESHRARLEIDPNDREALKALARLYESTSRWTDLVTVLGSDAAITADANEQKALQLRAAHVLEDKLTDIDRSIGLYANVLETFGPDREIHRALARLYEVADKWNDLLDILERDLASADSDADRLSLTVRIAELRRLKLKDLARAVEGHQEALAMDPSQATSRAALDELLTEKESGVALAAARALSPVLESESSWERLVAVLDRIAAETDDPDEKRQSLARAAEICEIGLNNPARAFGYAARELRESLGESDLRSRVDLLDRLANASGLHAEHVQTLKDVAGELVDPDLQIDVFMKIASISQERLNDRATARSYYEKALEQRPDYAPALDALERLHEGSGSYIELLEALRRKTELAVSDAERRELLRKQAVISEENLHNRSDAARSYESILEMGHEPEAAEALERIYRAESRWDDLTALLENQLSLPSANTVSLHHRLGLVAATHQDNPDRALDHYREVLDRQSDHEPTVKALEELGTREGYGARVAEMLEPIYLGKMDWPKVIAAMEARIAAESDTHTRKELLTRLGSLYEESLEDLDKALDTFARVFREEISDRGSWELVARLAKLLGRYDRQAQIYAGALEDVTSDDDSTAELAFEAGRLFDQHVHDTEKARALYRRALAFDPSRREVFDALEALLVRENAHRELLSLYTTAADGAGDPEEQKGFYFKIADIQERALQDQPAAIAAYRQILDIDVSDAKATDALDRLLTQTSKWQDLAELLDRRVNDAVDSNERAELRMRLGRVRADKLDDAPAAVDAFEAIVSEKRDHRDAIAALERLADKHNELRGRIVDILEPLYRELDDWSKLIVVLNARLQGVEDPMERGTILREIAQLKEGRATDVTGAFSAYASAFATDPGDGEARAEVERLAAKHGLWDELVRTYENAFAATNDSIIQADLLKSIAETHDTKRDDPRAAIAAYERLYALDDGQLEALDFLQGLHVLLSDWEGLVHVLERKAERSLDDEQKKALLHEIGEYQRDMIGDADKAVDAFKRAQDIDPSNAIALAALDDLYAARNDHQALSDVLRQRIDIESDPDERRQLALRHGKILEAELKDKPGAIDAFRRVLDDAPTDVEALSSLDRLYQATGNHADLIENLRAQTALASDEAARNTLRLRIGRLLGSELADPSGALEMYREVLSTDASNSEAVEAVRNLAQRESLRADAVAILEPIFRQGSRWNDLVEVIELKISSLDDPFAKRDEMRALAEVHESGRSDAATAFATHRRALHEDPAYASTISDLERLAASQDRWSELATILEEESRSTSDGDVSRDLAVRAAKIAEDRLRDDTRAVGSYRHALANGDEDTILASLDGIHLRNQQWRDLLDILEKRVAIASDPALLDELEVRTATIREQHFNDASGALSAYRNVIERSPSNAEALRGIERLVENSTTRRDALELLETTYTTLDDSQKMAWLLGLRVAGADLASDKVRLLGDLARLREERLNDLPGAFAATVDAFKLDPRDEQHVNEIERLAPAANGWSQLRGVVEATIQSHRDDLDPAGIASLNLRAARWYREQLNDDAAAEAALTAAVAAEPENADALAMLESVQRAPGRERDLVGTLRRRGDVELDVALKKQLYREAARIAESNLTNVDLAADITASLLESDDSDLEALEALARYRSAQNRHEDVAELLSRRARLVDDNALAISLRKQVAELYAGPINDLDRATQAYREVLDFDPNDQGARTAIEDILERTNRFKDLEEALRSRIDTAVSSDERNATRMRLARLAETRFSNQADAIEYLRQVIEETPTHSEAGSELERLYTQGRKWTDLSDLLERRAQDYADAHDLAGELAALVRIGELNERELQNAPRAVELYERVLERDANHVGALNALAKLHEGDQQWERAGEMLTRAAALATPGREGAEVALRLASLRAEKLNDDAGAEVALRRALELDRTTQQAIDRLKAMATKRNDPRMQAEILEHEVGVMTDTTKQVQVYKNLSDIARDKLADPARAAGYLEKARELAPDNKDLLLPLVDMYIAANRQRDAIPVIEKIIASYGGKRSKDLATWHHRLGQAMEALGDNAGALAQYDSAFKIDLTNVQILRDLGLLCYRSGDFDRAQKTLRALLLQRLDANSGITKADVYYYLGDTLRQQNDPAKAIQMLERAVEADKEHSRAKELLASLKK